MERPWRRRVARTVSLLTRVLSRIRGDARSSMLERLVRRRRAARVGLARSRPARLARIGERVYYAVVRRGEVEVFRRLEAHFRTDPDVRVIWDRRVTDRRAGADERRMTPAAAWQNTPYILVPKSDAASPPERRRS